MCRAVFQAFEVYNTMWPVRIGFLLQGPSVGGELGQSGVHQKHTRMLASHVTATTSCPIFHDDSGMCLERITSNVAHRCCAASCTGPAPFPVRTQRLTATCCTGSQQWRDLSLSQRAAAAFLALEEAADVVSAAQFLALAAQLHDESATVDQVLCLCVIRSNLVHLP